MLVRFALAGSRTKSSLLRVALCGLCLATYLGGGPMTAPALAEPRAVTKIAPNDTVELSVTGWAALKGGVAEATLLNDSFTVGRTGTLKLPFIGTLLAAGLTPAELERRIADRLQERSGLKDRAGTRVKLSEKPEATPESGVVEPTGEVTASTSSRPGSAGEPAEFGGEGSRADAVSPNVETGLAEVAAARKEAETARAALRKHLAADRLEQQLKSARSQQEKALAEARRERDAARAEAVAKLRH